MHPAPLRPCRGTNLNLEVTPLGHDGPLQLVQYGDSTAEHQCASALLTSASQVGDCPVALGCGWTASATLRNLAKFCHADPMQEQHVNAPTHAVSA
eukprot:77747-Amphidinium_carterae.1